MKEEKKSPDKLSTNLKNKKQNDLPIRKERDQREANMMKKLENIAIFDQIKDLPLPVSSPRSGNAQIRPYKIPGIANLR